MEQLNTKQQAHELIERMAPSHVATVVSLLETMLDPVSRAITNAPFDDERESEGERQAVAASKSWFERNSDQGISHEEILADFGLSPKDLKRQQ